ncbi:MAG: FKBP-type peptidyl-prolyl cis-trans isomerase, partial [Cytophagales bacterium]
MKAKQLKTVCYFALFGLISCVNSDQINPKSEGQLNYEQLVAEVAEIDKYIAANVTDYVAYSNSQVRFAIKKFGNDVPPKKGQTVNFQYDARLFSDTNFVFDQGNASTLLENISIVGLANQVSSLQNGTIATIFVPSFYAYGKNATATIPANATIIFNVTVNGVIRTAGEQAQFETDTAAIRKLVSTISGIQSHPSGIFYVINKSGNVGKFPKIYDDVNFSYDGRLISTNERFDSGSLNQSNIFSLIDGLRIGIPLLNEGSTATFYIPSGLGYGV